MDAVTRTTAAVLAAVAVLSCVSLIAFFALGGPFGVINDTGNGVVGVLCAVVAVRLHRPGRNPATALAIAGAATAVVGSFLVMTNTTGYFFAGLVSALGFALIGLWLLVRSRSDDLAGARVALTAGAVMALGLANIPGIVQGLDDQDSAPTWLLSAGICWAGTYLLLPIWAVRLAMAPPAGLEPAT